MTSRGQDRLFEAWMRDHQGIIFKVSHSFAAKIAEQEDLAQEIRICIWKSIPSFDQRCKASTFIYRISLNCAISWQRGYQSRQSKREKYKQSIEYETPLAEAPDERIDLIYREIRKLSEAERALILLQLEGHSYRDISDTLGISVANVGVRLNRVKAKLVAQLKERNR